MLEGEPFAFLKGGDYAFRLYARPALRQMQDLDIFVPAARIDAVTARLEAEGCPRLYPAGPASRSARHYERVHDLGPMRVDVHQAFLPPYRLRVDYRGVWERRVPCAAPCRASRLGDIDALVVHAIAMAKDEFTVPLARWLDLWLMLHGRGDLLPEAVERARSWRAERSLYGALSTLRALFPEAREDVPESTLARLLPPRARFFLDRHVLPAPGTRREDARRPRATQLWRKFWIIPSYPRRAAFALFHAASLARAALFPRRTP